MNRSSAAANLPRAPSSIDEARAALHRIEGWLSGGAVQVPAGPAAGGIAGWLDGRGDPVFAYGEITGYWLSWAAGLRGNRGAIAERIAAAVAFLDREWRRERPQNRRMLRAGSDWRNRALFSFDMAMMLRGLACAAEIVDSRACAAAAEQVLPWLLCCIRPDGTLATHILFDGEDPLPDRWSTRPGPFQTKTAAGLLGLPGAWLPAELARAAERTLAKWRGRAAEHLDLHPRLYALEGEILRGARVGPSLAGTALPSDGRLAANAAVAGGPVRSDVLAQAARLLIAAAGGDPGDRDSRIMALVGALLDHVTPEGAVLFELPAGPRNVWCAIFAAQALSWLAERAAGAAVVARRLV